MGTSPSQAIRLLLQTLSEFERSPNVTERDLRVVRNLVVHLIAEFNAEKEEPVASGDAVVA